MEAARETPSGGATRRRGGGGVMRLIALEYHDVLAGDDFAASGFTEPGADSYKMSAASFEAHLDAVAACAARTGLAVGQALRSAADGHAGRPAVVLTFDDGGCSAISEIAPRLESRGWHGLFFMTTGRIGTPGFLSGAELRELHGRGHVIGSHSHSHPIRMSACPADSLRAEWADSIDLLSDVLGSAVAIASVPGGYFSRTVAETAARAGIRTLFTSEPSSRATQVDGCTVLGRYTLRRDDPASLAAALVDRSSRARVRQWSVWNVKKVLKRLGGTAYLRARARLLDAG
jgi:peptidoglycan/xylan/chitin deacetylase (PgdA/CDA1 family)